MVFNQHIPTNGLSDNIDLIMHYKDFVPDHSIERVVPTGNTFLIFELDGYTRHTYDNETLKPNASYTKAWMSGMHKNFLSISAHKDSEMFVVQFKAGGAYPFINCWLEELNDSVVPAEQIFGNGVLELQQQLKQNTAPKDKFALVENWLNKKYNEQKQVPGELVKVLRQLQTEPVSNLQNIIKEFPNTQKHLIDLFKKYVGLTPKYYQRILRFNDILQRIQNMEKIAWADITYTCGYSDQSHFIKEFKHFSGFNPSEFIEEQHNQQSNFFPLDREG